MEKTKTGLQNINMQQLIIMITIIKHILTAIFKDGIKKKNYNSAAQTNVCAACVLYAKLKWNSYPTAFGGMKRK